MLSKINSPKDLKKLHIDQLSYLSDVLSSFIDDVITTGDAGDALFELFPDSAQSAKKIGFSGIITSAEYGATLGEIQIINISFITTGEITSAI